jgi:hypothetical protein
MVIACWNYIYLTLGDPRGSVPYPVHASHLCPGKRCCIHVQFEGATNNAARASNHRYYNPGTCTHEPKCVVPEGKLTLKDDFDIDQA